MRDAAVRYTRIGMKKGIEQVEDWVPYEIQPVKDGMWITFRMFFTEVQEERPL